MESLLFENALQNSINAVQSRLFYSSFYILNRLITYQLNSCLPFLRLVNRNNYFLDQCRKCELLRNIWKSFVGLITTYKFLKWDKGYRNTDTEIYFQQKCNRWLLFALIFFFFFIHNNGSTQTFTKLKIHNHQTPKYSKGIWQ